MKFYCYVILKKIFVQGTGKTSTILAAARQLFGDLFKDSVDEIIEPLDAMRAEFRASQAIEMAKEEEMANSI